MSSPTILITGFDAYGRISINPSEWLVVGWNCSIPKSWVVVTHVLPTKYNAASAQLEALLTSHQPDLVVMFGHSDRITAPKVERYAKNEVTATSADNSGQRLQGPIDPTGRTVYETNLPIENLIQAMRGAGLKAYGSVDAGGYVCNAAYYRAFQCLEQQDYAASCVFVHVPSVPTQEEQRRLRRAAECLVTAAAGLIH